MTHKIFFLLFLVLSAWSCKKDTNALLPNKNIATTIDSVLTTNPIAPILDSTYLFKIPDSEAFDDSQIKTGRYNDFYKGYYSAIKNGKRVIGSFTITLPKSSNPIPLFCPQFSVFKPNNVDFDNMFKMYGCLPFKIGTHKVEADLAYYWEVDECSTRAAYHGDSTKVSFIKVLSIEKNPSTQKTSIRGRFKMYYTMETQEEGEHFPKNLAFEEGVFWGIEK